MEYRVWSQGMMYMGWSIGYGVHGMEYRVWSMGYRIKQKETSGRSYKASTIVSHDPAVVLT